jgi:hypothetical protein
MGILRSTLSMSMAPIDGVRVGVRPLVKKLLSGVSNMRPPRRAKPELWGPMKVLDVFHLWPVELPLSDLIRKGVFLVALITAKRPSGLAALLCDGILFRWGGVNLCFVPSRLTKAVHPGLFAPPVCVKPWKEGLCVCPVEAVRPFLLERVRLGLQRCAIFFSWTFPHRPLDAAAVERCLQFCLAKAGISATPASSRSITASAALAGSASLGDVLSLGDWSSASSYFRFHHAL